MGNAFDRSQAQIQRRQASRDAAAHPSDPAKVKHLAPSHFRPLNSSDRYEQGMIDGLNGKTAQPVSDESPRLFGAYLKGVKAGSRARLARSRREAEAREKWAIPDRPTPSADQVAAELAERIEQDETSKARRQRSGILRDLAC